MSMNSFTSFTVTTLHLSVHKLKLLLFQVDHILCFRLTTPVFFVSLIPNLLSPGGCSALLNQIKFPV